MEDNELCKSCKHYKEHMHIMNLHKMKMCTVSTSRVLNLKDVHYKTDKCGLYIKK